MEQMGAFICGMKDIHVNEVYRMKRGPKAIICSHGISPRRNCKECNNDDKKRWRELNPEKARAKSRKYHKNHRNKINKYKKEWRKQNPKKVKAMNIVNHNGFPLASGCELCPVDDKITEKLEHHHPDYEFPEIYVTTCKSCHYYADNDRRGGQ